ncbi:hypothetical protein AXF42_Ash012752 [Apostasia shenzhenica]|uniref:Uncharacterized protein n=1 Tax=Apostasia shenzhenica TaxID=1088818 RepID=A0A2I0AM33_9ASPA|nr:hypothetical protein AXF42_Ash012752 [Apostasia shenzhenica]
MPNATLLVIAFSTLHASRHAFDVYGDLLGLLAAHPIAPLVSIHHLDVVEPIFPKSPSRPAAIRRLFDAPSASTPPGSCSRLRHAEAVSWAISYLARAVCLSNLVCLPISSGWFRREIEDRCRLIKVQCYSGESTANFSIVGLAKLLEQLSAPSPHPFCLYPFPSPKFNDLSTLILCLSLCLDRRWICGLSCGCYNAQTEGIHLTEKEKKKRDLRIILPHY